ncbi:hypothetical protein PIB30_041439 [Stylosanthes scabra]|uniref:Uncharacterized protein n=1 Tax=Stylosanthes scabra TaxID=79078 RepID=A0ABU6XF91_9FABA|nr:hypothetical protein [Stylosanthes scabra]
MADERASNSSTSTDESMTTDKTQPSPGASAVAVTSATLTPRGAGGFAIKNNLIYSNYPPNTQHIPQGWYPSPPQGGNYGYSNNPQPPFVPFGTCGGAYNSSNFNACYQHLMNNLPQFGPIPSTPPIIQPIPIPQPSQAAVSIPQVVSTGENRPTILEMSRKMPIEPNPANNTVESLAVFRRQIEESHHDLINMLTQQMAIVLTPMIENNNARDRSMI